MTDDNSLDEIPSLSFLVDQAAEAMRQANHHTYIAREVTDLYAVLGGLHALFSRFDHLAGYLLATVGHTDPAELRHDEGGDTTVALATIIDALTQARDLTGQTTRAVDRAWSELSHLALNPVALMCPECGEPAYRGIPIDLTPIQRSAAVRPRHRHADGTQLCRVIGTDLDPCGGYQPATPVRPDAADPYPTSTCPTSTCSTSTCSTSTTGTTDPQ